MKSVIRDILTALFMGLVLPFFLLNLSMVFTKDPEPPAVERQAQPVSVLFGERREEMDREDYLTGVLLGEMPASFEPEALKAQAVVARTYTAKVLSGEKHGGSTICTDFACCQAYISPEDYLARGGTQEGLDRIRSAVTETGGQVLTYEGDLIEATYFSCSGGSTEDAAAVWGTDYPYLQATPSPGEEEAGPYADTVTFTPESFCNLLNWTPEGSPDTWFGPVTYTEGGGVATMEIGGRIFEGTRLRKDLDLRSTIFTVEASAEEIVIHTRGYGHRVGMSQYGANAMAKSGAAYREILAHYYRGTALEQLTNGG